MYNMSYKLYFHFHKYDPILLRSNKGSPPPKNLCIDLVTVRERDDEEMSTHVGELYNRNLNIIVKLLEDSNEGKIFLLSL